MLPHAGPNVGTTQKEEKEMVRLIGCLFLVLIIAPVFAADEDGKDPSTWTPIRIPGRQRAPEFADITAWINSPPLKMSDLKGKVVVVHFMAFG
jgi:hypothetical protein